MFTGLIESTGTLLQVEESKGTKRIRVSAPHMAPRLKTGDSIAVSGVCLTALDISMDPPAFYADLAAETLARTSLAYLAEGAEVNLELPTPAGTPLGGHVVQGHVDATGSLLSLDPVSPGASNTDWLLRVEVPEAVGHYIVEKGSIAIEGISLTVAAFDRQSRILSVAIIPHTFAHTNLRTLTPGSLVNLESDVLLRFAAQQQQRPGFGLSVEYLVANGY